MRRIAHLTGLILLLAAVSTALAWLIVYRATPPEWWPRGFVLGPPDVQRVEPAGAANEAPRLYVVLDDAGHDVAQIEWFADFPGTLTIAVLPLLPDSTASARRAAALGHEVILHQPMEPVSGTNPGPGAILGGDSAAQIRATVRTNLASIPQAVGLNNHMGSLVTSDRHAMTAVMEAVTGTAVYFLDSRTIHTSVAHGIAREHGVPSASRNVFLDNERTTDAIRRQLTEGLAIARESGFAVMIGHVTVPQLAEVLIGEYPAIIDAGFEFRAVGDLVGRETVPSRPVRVTSR